MVISATLSIENFILQWKGRCSSFTITSMICLQGEAIRNLEFVTQNCVLSLNTVGESVNYHVRYTLITFITIPDCTVVSHLASGE